MTGSVALLAMMALVAAGAVASLVAEMVGSRFAAKWMSVLALLAGAAVALYAGWTEPSGLAFGVLRTGGALATVSGIVLFASALGLAASEEQRLAASTPVLVSLAAGGACVAAVSADLVVLLVGLEMAAVCGYALVSSARSARSDEAAMKYFAQGAVATGLLLLGIAVLVGRFGEPSLELLAKAITGNGNLQQAASLGAVAVIAAVAFKAGAAPFHSWAPDAYETAPAESAAVLAGGVKLAMVAALTSFAFAITPAGVSDARPFGLLMSDVFPLVGALAVVSIVVGSTVALKTRSYARMLGYAGVAQVGYAMIAVAAQNPAAALFFTSTYALATTAAFSAAAAFRRVAPEWDGTIDGMTGLAKRAPLVSAALTFTLISLAGIPPLIGFWGKFQAFGSAIQTAYVASENYPNVGISLAALAVVGVVGSIISLGYYGGVVRALYFGQESATQSAGESRTGAGSAGAVVIVLAVGLVVLGAAPLIFGIATSLRGFTG